MTKKNETSTTDKAMQYEPLLGSVISIESLDISIRCYQLLKANKITDLRQLSLIKKDDMVKMRNFGMRSLKELDEEMKLHNISWAV